MNTYKRKLSSGLVLSLLVISSFAFVTPLLIAPTHASKYSATVGLTYPYVTVGAPGVGAVRTLTITNPSGNQGITEVDVSISTSAATAVGPAAFVDGFINDAVAPSVAGSGPWTIVYTGTASGDVILPQGAAGHVDFTFSSEGAESVTGTADAYSLTVIVTYTDGSTSTSSVTLYEGAAAGVTAAFVTATPQTVNTPLSATAATNVADQGIPLVWSSTPSVSTLTTAGFSASFTPATGTTSASGSVSTTFVSTEATETAGVYTLSADAGTPYASDSGGMLTPVPTAAMTLTPAAPTQVTVGTFWDVPSDTPTYISATTAAICLGLGAAPTPACPLSISLADKYGNAQEPGGPAAAVTTFTAHALEGQITYVGAMTDGTISNVGVITSGASYAALNPTTLAALPYGTYDLVTVTLTVPSTSPNAGTYTGSSKQLFIGYLGTWNGAAPIVTVYTASKDTGPGGCPTPNCPAPATTVGLSLTTTQVGVPVNFTLTSTSATVPYTGTFVNGLSWIVVNSNANGIALANFTSDATLGDEAVAAAIVPEPTTASPSTVVPSANTLGIWTGYGSPAELGIATSFDNNYPAVSPSAYVAPSGTLYVVVFLADAYGNVVANPTASAYQITIAASAGSLTATTTYIIPTKSDTFDSGYVVQYAAPSSIGTVTMTASTTAFGIKAATTTINVVSPNPSVYLTSSGSLTTNTATITGYGTVSPAEPAGTAVIAFTYSLNGGANVTTPITSTNSSGAAFFSFSASLLNGTNTLKIYATDSQSNVGFGIFTLTVTHPPPGLIFTSVGSAQEVFNGFTGAAANFTNTDTVSHTVNVYFVWYNSATQVVSVGAQLNVAFASGATASFFNSYTTPGTYTVKVFVQDTSGNALSVSYPTTVTIP